jgi:hypothetical protein
VTLPAALAIAMAHGVAIRHVDWVPGRSLHVDGDELIDRVPQPHWHDGKMRWVAIRGDYRPTYAEAVSVGWEVA